jgi:hypothetical protein
VHGMQVSMKQELMHSKDAAQRAWRAPAARRERACSLILGSWPGSRPSSGTAAGRQTFG